MSTSGAYAATEIQWWHAMGGRNGEKVAEIAAGFNASQSDYTVTAVFKGTYTETMTAAIAAFRAGEQPHIVQVFEVGTATMMAAEGAIYPVHQLMADTGEPFDPTPSCRRSRAITPPPRARCCRCRSTARPRSCGTTRPRSRRPASTPRARPRPGPSWSRRPRRPRPRATPAASPRPGSPGSRSRTRSAWHNQPIATRQNGFAGLDTELVFNQNDVVPRHIANMAEWQQSKIFDYGGRTNEAAPKFYTQDCVMFTESSAGYGGMTNNVKDFEFGIGMLPYYDDVAGAPQNSIIGGASLWVLQGKSAEEYQGVAKFFTYLSSPEVQADWHQATGYLPITTAAYELSKEQGFYDAEPGHRHRDPADHAEPADRELEGPAARQLRADSRHHRRGARGGLERQQERAGGARRGRRARQPAAARVRGRQLLSTAAC